MTAPRTIQSVDTLPEHRHGSRLVTRDASLATLGPELDPFLMISLYAMRGPTFPPHPHAGFMVATYILPGSEVGFVNQDSLGTRNRIAPGSLHVTVAGRGVMHEEQPEAEGPLAEGFQIWIDLPDAQREIAPHSRHLPADEVPRFTQPGVDVRVVLGAAFGHRSPLELPTSLSLVDVQLAPHAALTHELPAGDNAFVFMLGGSLTSGDQRASGGQLMRTRADGEQLVISAGAEGARYTLFAGTPLAQPRAMHGPFVGRDRAQLVHFAREFEAGRFGSVVPFDR